MERRHAFTGRWGLDCSIHHTASFIKPIHFAHFAAVLALSPAAVLPAGAQLISFEALNTIHVSENAGILKVGVLRAGSNEATSKVRYRLVDAGFLSPASGELVFASGEQRHEILMTVLDDSKSAQGDRLGTLVLYDPEGAQLSPEGNPGPVVAEQSRTIGVIDNEFTRDDPTSPQVEFAPTSQSVAAGESAAKVRIRRLGDSGESLRLEYSTLNETAKAGVHYLAQAASVTLAPLETEAILSVPLLAGPMINRELSFGLLLLGVENGRSWTTRGTLRIVDDRRPGTVDLSFDAGLLEGDLPAGGRWWSVVEDMTLLPDGRLFIGGHLHTGQGIPRDGIARLLPDGRLDFTFREHAWDFHLGGDVHWLSVQPDGRVVTGKFAATYMRRFFPDGTGDASFVPVEELIPARTGFEAPNLEMRLDGNGLSRLARMLPDGREDPSFQMADDFLAGGSILATAMQSDGKILIGGYFPGAIVRLNADGTRDTSFDVGTGARGAAERAQAMVGSTAFLSSRTARSS